MFDKILRELREEKKLTQSELAKFLNVSRASISAYENRTNDPSLDVLIKMADFFNVSLDYLLGRTPEKFNNNLIPTNDADLISYLQSTIEKYKSKKWPITYSIGYFFLVFIRHNLYLKILPSNLYLLYNPIYHYSILYLWFIVLLIDNQYHSIS